MKKILVIEDESALQKSVRDLLESKGYEVFSALNGKIGLELALAKQPDLILLDLILPRMNGFDVLSELKKEEKTKHIPVLVLTNLEGADDVERALELGAKGYLLKSDYSLEDLGRKVEEILSQHES